ncbi:ATP-binding protein [Desulfonatronum sp. SC1]|uniref:ATP-binding protein n=1 Tax=Desulfonatronum sp. SC1 TaxID=2109626 RepID=UPI000D2F935B|nr:ATP-binding protein [Desulfonatronum sp. SC1]PTN39049.1 tRNA(Ile)-lysidine synthetase [Desulfonatronum sp. SC1]
MKCRKCKALAAVALPSHNTAFCPDCYPVFVRSQVERAIHRHKMIAPGDRVLVAVSGGKDSLALTLLLHELGHDVHGLHVDLDIPGSSTDARAACEGFFAKLGLPFTVVELRREGLAIPLVKSRIKRPICSVCGKLKRHYFNKFALENGFSVLATGHNLDDEVSRLFANTMRWDASYLSDQGPVLPAADGFARKVKPMYRLTEFEIANFSFLRGIDHVIAGCPYSGRASFPVYKSLWSDLEGRMHGAKVQFYENFLRDGRPVFAAWAEHREDPLSPCTVCGYPTSAEVCGVCRIREMVRVESEAPRS